MNVSQQGEVAISPRKRPLSSSSSLSTPPPVVRNVESLYVHPATWNCAARQGCLVCAYKIACFDVALDYEFTKRWPNQRPETCPRLQRQQQQQQHAPSGSNNILYGNIDDNDDDNDEASGNRGTLTWPCFRSNKSNNKKLKVLTVGDGDFSFSVALARHMGPDAAAGGGLTATSYESQTRLEQVYPSKVLQLYWNELKEAGAQVQFQVDATNLSAFLSAGSCSSSSSSTASSWDVVIWNFPCTAEKDGQDGQNQAMEANKALVQKFCANVSAREIHITHKTKPPFDQWDLVHLVTSVKDEISNEPQQQQQQRWTYVGRVVLDRALWPPYVPRKALDQKSFPCHDACTYVFQQQESSSSSSSATTSSWLSETLKPVTVECIQELRDYWMDPRRTTMASSKAYQSQQNKRKKSRRRR